MHRYTLFTLNACYALRVLLFTGGIMSKNGYVYLFRCSDFYKIGYSKNVYRRLKQLDTRPFPLDCIAAVYSERAWDIEQYIHKAFYSLRAENEWYQFDFFPQENEFYDFVKQIEMKLEEKCND
jgi:hypothetical protein